MTTHELTDAEKIGLAAVPAEDREAEAEKLEQEAVLAVTPDEEARVAEEAVPGGPPSAKELAAEQKEPAEVAEASNAEARAILASVTSPQPTGPNGKPCTSKLSSLKRIWRSSRLSAQAKPSMAPMARSSGVTTSSEALGD